MKVSILGSEGTILCQTATLRAGFAAMGHEHTFDTTHPDTAFVFVGNPPYSDYLHLRGQKKLIFNVLDIPWHLPNVGNIVNQLRQQLPYADRVTAISYTVAEQVEKHCGVKCEPIYYPMKPVRYTGERKYPQFRVLLAGRLSDPNKRVSAAVQALVRAGFNENEICVVCSDRIGYGTEMGLVSDAVLNDLYNSVDYVISLAREEGIGLVPIEAACCGAIPIVAPDLSTFNEFWVESPLGLNYQTLTSVDKVAELLRELERNREWREQVKQDVLAYATLAFRPKFEAKAVASRIIETYQSI